jgi:hypothetical protein
VNLVSVYFLKRINLKRMVSVFGNLSNLVAKQVSRIGCICFEISRNPVRLAVLPNLRAFPGPGFARSSPGMDLNSSRVPLLAVVVLLALSASVVRD